MQQTHTGYDDDGHRPWMMLACIKWIFDGHGEHGSKHPCLWWSQKYKHYNSVIAVTKSACFTSEFPDCRVFLALWCSVVWQTTKTKQRSSPPPIMNSFLLPLLFWFDCNESERVVSFPLKTVAIMGSCNSHHTTGKEGRRRTSTVKKVVYGKEIDFFEIFCWFPFLAFESTAREIVAGWRQSRHQPLRATLCASTFKRNRSLSLFRWA